MKLIYSKTSYQKNIFKMFLTVQYCTFSIISIKLHVFIEYSMEKTVVYKINYYIFIVYGMKLVYDVPMLKVFV